MEGTPFGRYRLIERLGRGGMGEVWRAFDPDTNRVVALKMLSANVADDPQFEERFRREALAAAGLTNPHVVPIHNFGEIEGRLYVDMALIEGRDLRSILTEGPLPAGRAMAIVGQIASALQAAHRIGLVHRDVKPSNILVDDEDSAYLIDFGIARAVGEKGLTGTGNVIGTWAYMSPERLTSGQTDPRADIYALACVLHECLTGRQPFPGESIEQQITGHLTLPPPRPSTQRHDLPTELDTVIATGMAKNPDDRYSTVTEMAQAAREAITVPTTRPLPPEPMRPTERRTEVPTMAATPPNPPESATAGVSPSPAVLPTVSHAPPNPQPWQPAGPTATGPNRQVLWVLGIAAAVVIVGLTLFTLSQDKGSAPPSTSAITEGATVSAAPSPTTNESAFPTTVAPPPITTPPQQRDWTAVIVGTCDEGGSCGVKQRTGPYNDAPRLVQNTLQDGTVVTLVCQTTGDYKSSAGHGSSNVWYRLDNGAYVNSVYMNLQGSGIPTC